MAITPDSRIRRVPDVLYAPVGTDEGVMLSVAQGCYYGVNTVAARICEMAETPVTVAEIVARLGKEFDVDPRTVETEVTAFVTTLVANGIVREDA